MTAMDKAVRERIEKNAMENAGYAIAYALLQIAVQYERLSGEMRKKPSDDEHDH